MNILHINTSDSGGAAKACLRLHQGLLEQGINSKVLLRKKNENYPNTELLRLTRGRLFQRRLKSSLYKTIKKIGLAQHINLPFIHQRVFKEQRDKRLEKFRYPFSSYDIIESPLYEEADIINLHWVADFLDWESFFSKNKKPVVWTLHDQGPFLGGEHYKERYLGVDENGLPLERIIKQEEFIEENKLLNFKKRILSNVNNITTIANSKWLKEKAIKSELFNNYNNLLVHYGFPTATFKIYNRKFCRDVLNISHEKLVILFVADSIDNSRKGYFYLKNALSNLCDKYNRQVILCSVGNKKGLINTNNNVLELGKVSEEKYLAIIYNAADLFVIPSLEEAFGQTTIEAQLCGVPTIGFPTGGILDSIQDGINGYLCPTISVQALKETIEKFLNNPEVFDRKKISEKAKKKYTMQKQAKKYIDIYKSILLR